MNPNDTTKQDTASQPTSRRGLLALGGAGLGALITSGCVEGYRDEEVAAVALALSNSKLDAIETVADLTALPAPGTSDAQVYQVLGYDAVGDGGGGIFFWDSSSSATEDGGTVFERDAGGTGRWFRLYAGGQVSVRWFGATGDGSTDDTVEIQAAFDAAESNDRITSIFLPPGEYIVTAPIEISVSCQGLEVVGAGWSEIAENTTLRNSATTATPLFRTTGTGTLAFLRVGNFRCLQSATAGYFFEFEHLTVHLELFRVHFNISNTGAGAVLMDGVENHMNWIHDCKAVGSEMTVPMYHWKGPSSSNLSTTTFERLTTNTPDCTKPQILVENFHTTASPGFAFKSLNIEQPDGGGVHLYGVASAYFENCITSDTANQTEPVYLLDKLHASQTNLGATFVDCHSYVGTETYPDLTINDSVGGVDPGPVTCIGGRFTWVDPGPYATITMINTTNTGYVTGGKPPLRLVANSILGLQGIGGESYTRNTSGVDRARHFSGVATFSGSGSVTVTFTSGDVGGADPEADTSYEVLLGPNANETIWVDQSSKTTTTFDLKSSNSSSNARVAWMMVRT